VGQADHRGHPGILGSLARREGVKAIVKAVMQATSRHKTPSVEMYDQGRYFTLTGHLVPDTASVIMERQAEFDALYRETFPRSRPRGKIPRPM
jgi:hypothetical protein